jgi:hypothetical protein
LNVGFYLQLGLFLKNKFPVGIGYILMLKLVNVEGRIMKGRENKM